MTPTETHSAALAVRDRLRAEGNGADADNAELRTVLNLFADGDPDDLLHEVCYLDLQDKQAELEIRNLVETFWRES